jgi:membrane protease YdiL (CAAX protease family)
LSGVAGPARSGRIEGWSKAPFGTRLPAMLLVAIVGLAAVLPEAAPFVFLGLLFAYLYTRRFGTRSTAIAAVLPAAAILVWRAIPQPLADVTGADCTNVLAPPAIWRFLEAAVGLVALGALLWDRRGSLGELGFRRGSRRVLLVALVALLLVAPIAVYAATVFGRPELVGIFFGSYRLDLSQPMALIPALVFAASNALAEELAYRGAMRTWLTPSLGVTGANLAQAVLFGLSHTGRDFVGVQGVIPVMLGMVIVGYVAGVIARRTRSLTIPLAIHAAADIPIYLYWACQLA